jgi:hypothetical protein
VLVNVNPVGTGECDFHGQSFREVADDFESSGSYHQIRWFFQNLFQSIWEWERAIFRQIKEVKKSCGGLAALGRTNDFAD